MFKNKGFALPVVLVFTAIFVALPVILWVAVYNNKSSDVKGIQVSNLQGDGVYAEIESTGGTWDALAFTCPSQEKCAESLEAGKAFGVVGGGSDFHTIKFLRNAEWSDSKYLKIYVRPSWGSLSRMFFSKPAEKYSTKDTFPFGGKTYEAIIVDLSKVPDGSGMVLVGSFSDK